MTPAETLTAAADRLDALAQGATPGPWAVQHGSPAMNGSTWTLRTAGVPGIKAVVQQYTFHADADLIVTLDPITACLLAQVLRRQSEAAMLDLAEYILRGDA